MAKYNIVYIMIAATMLCGCRGGTDVGGPIDKHATPETRALYKNLKKISSEGVMFGQQDATLYGVDWKYEPDMSDVKSVCGDYPAVYGWELGDIEFGGPVSLDAVPFDTIREHIVAAYLRGGVNTVSWHANNPLGGNAWDKDTDEAVKSILPGGKNHGWLKNGLDILAGFFLSLEAPGGELVPVIFRPFHEHSGNWFWWGSAQCTPGEYNELWRFTVDYLRDVKNVHNLLYAISPDIMGSEEEYLGRYPGDEYADIMGFDCYYGKDDTYVESAKRTLAIASRLAAGRNKVAAFTETGYEGIPDPEWWTKDLLPIIKGQSIAYVLVWRNAYSGDMPGHYFAPHPGCRSADDFVKFYEDSSTIFEADLPDMYK